MVYVFGYFPIGFNGRWLALLIDLIGVMNYNLQQIV